MPRQKRKYPSFSSLSHSLSTLWNPKPLRRLKTEHCSPLKSNHMGSIRALESLAMAANHFPTKASVSGLPTFPYQLPYPLLSRPSRLLLLLPPVSNAAFRVSDSVLGTRRSSVVAANGALTTNSVPVFHSNCFWVRQVCCVFGLNFTNFVSNGMDLWVEGA